MHHYWEQLARYLVSQSWQIGVLTVLVAGASYLLRNRSAHTRYLLWLLVPRRNA